jgi:hypothetical protein
MVHPVEPPEETHLVKEDMLAVDRKIEDGDARDDRQLRRDAERMEQPESPLGA